MLTGRQKLVVAATATSGLIVPLSLWVRHRGSSAVVDDVADLSPAAAAIILGCCARPDGTPSNHLRQRLEAGLRVYQQGVTQRIVVSGDASALANEVVAMKAWLLERHVPPDHIVEDPTGVRTYASMRNASRLHGLSEVIVCTHRYHLPRSLYLARRFGMKAQGLIADQTRLERPVRTHGREFAARAMAAIDGWLVNGAAEGLLS